jgi:SAM-dependent methyltransferase
MMRPLILNVGCGTRTSAYCTNIDWSPILRLKASRFGARMGPLLLKGNRLESYQSLAGEVVVHDIRRGLPAADQSVDAVYHSHVLEHLDRDLVPSFLSEVHRVLKPRGVHRIVVPDFETACRTYVNHLEDCVARGECSDQHESHIAAIIEQMVRREAFGTSQQSPIRRRIENVILGDARKRGETHQWMYDRVSLRLVLEREGFRRFVVVDKSTSAIPGWENIDLDRGPDGGEYKPGSLYVEAVR